MTVAAFVLANEQHRQQTATSTMIRDCEVVNSSPVPHMLTTVGDTQIITGSSSGIMQQPGSPLPIISSGNVSPRSPLECEEFPSKLSSNPSRPFDIVSCSATRSAAKKQITVPSSKMSKGSDSCSPPAEEGVTAVATSPAGVDADDNDTPDAPDPPAISPTRPTPLMHSRRSSSAGANRKSSSPRSSPRNRVKKNLSEHGPQEQTSDPTTSTTDDGGSGKKRSVRFNHTVHFREIRHISEYTDEQIEATWLTPEDYAAIKQVVKITIRAMMKGEFIAEDNPEYCTRGLEFRTKNGSKVRARNKVRARSAVLNEQDMQREEGYNEQQMIAMTCMEASLCCRQGARARGLYDERMIQSYLHNHVPVGLNSNPTPTPALKSPPAPPPTPPPAESNNLS